MQTTCTLTSDPGFLGTVASWLENQPDILVLFRCAHAAGANGFEFFPSYSSFVDRIQELPPQTSVLVFRQPQLPLRGFVDDGFIARCLENIPDDAEYLAVETVRQVHGGRSWFHDYAGISHAQLHDDLEESRGVPVAVGLYPNCSEEAGDIVSAIVPDDQEEEGSGIYDLKCSGRGSETRFKKYDHRARYHR